MRHSLLPASLLALAACSPNAEMEERLNELAAQNVQLQAALAEQQFAAAADPGGMNVTYVPYGEGDERIPDAVREIAEVAGNGLDENLTATGAPAARATAIDPQTAWSLRGTTWVALDFDTRAYTTLQFGAAIATLTNHEGESTASAVDYSATNTACLGNPMCVTSIGAEGRLQTQHFVRIEEFLYPIQCFDWTIVGEGGPIPPPEQLEAGSGQQVVRHAGNVFCLRDPNTAPFRPYTVPESPPNTVNVEPEQQSPIPDDLPPFPRFRVNDDGSVTTLGSSQVAPANP